MDARIEKIIMQAGDLMPMSSSVGRAIQTMNQPNSSASDLAEVLTFDMALAAKLLRVANSAYYGFERKVATVSEAIVRLGFTTIRRLILTSQVSGFMSKKVDSYGLGQGELWKHSIGVGMGAMFLAQKDRSALIGEAYLAGLVHDIGKAFLDQYLATEIKLVMEKANSQEISSEAAEKEVLGTDHAEVGAMIAQRWNLPLQIVEAIAYHHSPLLAKQSQRLAAMVHVTDVVFYSSGLVSDTEGLHIPKMDLEVAKLLNLQDKDIENLQSHLVSSLQFAEVFLEEPGERKVASAR